jgi:hypothetical protein
MTGLAAPEHLPAPLRHPPWAGGAHAVEPPTLPLPPFMQAPRLCWSGEERASARLAFETQCWRPEPLTPQRQEEVLDALGIRAQVRAGLRGGAPLRATDFMDPQPRASLSPHTLLQLPDALALSLWNGVASQQWDVPYETALTTLLARHGEAAAPGLVAYAARRPVQGLRVGRYLDCPELAALALKSRRGLKVALQSATDWLLTHPRTSANVLLRQLFGGEESAREDARAALHVLAAQGLQGALEQAAQDLGDAARAGLSAELKADPLLRLPARMPRLPAFFVPARLHRPRLAGDGAALPDEAMQHLGLMLAISRTEQAYAGLDAVRAACTPASLAEFAWDLFEAWWAAGAPSKDAWALAALGWLGDDGTAHRLGPRALRLAKEGARQRALAMVDLLAGFGSDAALMHLNNLAERCTVGVVRNRAAAGLDAVAAQRGLSRIELADRLVPTLGLDESRTLDFGPRQFHIRLDETLAPHVTDAQGARLKDLPKPRQSDDMAKADAAVLRYRRLKSELKALAKVQVARLEQAMVMQRRWVLEDFRTLFVRHPLTRELAARLLWTVSDAALQPVETCRIAEDGTLADARDERYDPPVHAQIGLSHPLLLPALLREAFGRQFADYEILQPFAQLTRETFACTPQEAGCARILRVEGSEIATGAAIALLDRGWRRGPAEEGGMIGTLLKPMGPAGQQAVLQLNPGMPVMQLSAEPRQTLGAVWLQDAQGHAATWGGADAVPCSELLRDLHRLAPFTP